MINKYWITAIVLLGLFFTPFFADAHVKWFTNEEPVKESIENIITPFFMFMTIFTAFVLAILPQIVPKMMKWDIVQKIDNKMDDYRKYNMSILRYGTAIVLIIQVLSGSLFAPELHQQPNWFPVLAWIAIILLFVPNFLATKTAAVILLGMFSIVVYDFGIFHMLDYAFYLPIFIIFLIAGTNYEKWSFPFLYLATGLSLCWVAVEKLVYPSMTIDIIVNHNVPTFGFPPEIFIVMAAFIEFIVGYLLVVGILNRLLAIVLTGIFMSTTMLFGALELVGHAMIHIILVLFIIEGTSFYRPPVKIHKTVIEQMIFVFLNFIFVLATILLIYYRFA
ncbi:DoxX family membrane protein [Thalassorhabdus alkalitolerans]|uniref:DoxX family membrane protein n=1 Tax=Thalassorhabdus alkalitolerans TaxID=2282697 RepID=A0ABW0YLM5_9BACI